MQEIKVFSEKHLESDSTERKSKKSSPYKMEEESEDYNERTSKLTENQLTPDGKHV